MINDQDFILDISVPKFSFIPSCLWNKFSVSISTEFYSRRNWKTSLSASERDLGFQRGGDGCHSSRWTLTDRTEQRDAARGGFKKRRRANESETFARARTEKRIGVQTRVEENGRWTFLRAASSYRRRSQWEPSLLTPPFRSCSLSGHQPAENRARRFRLPPFHFRSGFTTHAFPRQ